MRGSCSPTCDGELGSQGADDAFQETFLRALRAYGRLQHGEHLRAWALTIATNVAVDTLRRTGREHLTAEPPETPFSDSEPAFLEIAESDGRTATEGAGRRRAPLRLRPDL